MVIGAHLDSINLFFPSLLAAPGADDDGSGTVTILEAFRVLIEYLKETKTQLEQTLEFHWYSAEEGGLLGSQAIFHQYERTGRDVVAMLQQDMTGFVQKTLDAGKPESVGVITDFVDVGLTDFIKKVGIPFFTCESETHSLRSSPNTVTSRMLRRYAVMLAQTMPVPPKPAIPVPLSLKALSMIVTTISIPLTT